MAVAEVWRLQRYGGCRDMAAGTKTLNVSNLILAQI